MRYEIRIEHEVLKDLRKIPGRDRLAIEEAISALGENPRPSGCGKVKGTPDWKIRVDVYWVRYRISFNELLVLVVRVGLRKEVYRRR